MNNTNIYYSPKQGRLPVFISDFLEISDPVMTFDHLMEEIGIAKYLKCTAAPVGRKGYNPVNMLKTILFGFMDKGSQDFIDYVVWRIDNHANVLSSDELDVIEGYFLDAQLSKKIESSAVFFPANGPSLIDKIYFEKHGIPYEFPGAKNTDVRKRKKIRRNEPCPCGSGKKFKRCCLGKGIYD